jgi:hypothetical protein
MSKCENSPNSVHFLHYLHFIYSPYIFAPAMKIFIHQVSAVYLLIIVLLRMLAMPISLIDYSVNKNFIASNFCENRLRENVHCAGQCYLRKQLTKANDNTESRDQKGTIKTGIVDFFEPFDKPVFHCDPVSSGYGAVHPSRYVSGKFITSVFHPPIA